LLRKDDARGNSYLVDTAWIPEACAKVGKYIKIKRENGSWDDGWEVVEVYSKKSIEYLDSKERDYLKQRNASDV